MEAAWLLLQDAATWESIAGVDRVFDVRRAPDDTLAGYGFEATAAGTRYRGTAVVAESRRPTTMRLDIDAAEVGGWIRTDLRVDGGGVAITVTVRLEARGLLAGMFFPVLRSVVAKGLPTSVEDFAERIAEG